MLSRGHYFLFHGSNKDLERDPRGKSYRATTSFSTNVFGTIYMPSSSTFPLAVRCPEYPCISVNSLLAVNRTSVNQIPYFVHWQLSLCTDQTNLCTLGFTSNIYIYYTQHDQSPSSHCNCCFAMLAISTSETSCRRLVNGLAKAATNAAP